MTTLITGAAGFVGSHLIDLLEKDSAPIVALLRPGTEPLVSGTRVVWHSVELHDRGAVTAAIEAVAPSEIYHLAGVPHVGDSWAHVHETFAGNVLGTHHLFSALRRARLKPRVLITSSATVYQPLNRAITESDAIRPNSPYGTSKLAQEMVGIRAWEDDGIPALVARSFNHVGPRQAPSFVASSIAKQIAEIEAGKKPPVLSMGNLESERDMMDVRDTVRAYYAIVCSGQTRRPYNVCSGQAHTMRRLLDILLSLARVRVRVEIDPARLRPSDNAVILGSHARLTADTGWTPVIPIEQTLADLLEHWRRATAA